MIAFVINTCDALNVDIHLQYNESLDPSKLSIATDDDPVPPEEMYGPTVISIGGMTCAACTGTVERALLTLERVVVSLPFQEAKLVPDADVSKDALVSAVEDVGYDAKIILQILVDVDAAVCSEYWNRRGRLGMAISKDSLLHSAGKVYCYARERS